MKNLLTLFLIVLMAAASVRAEEPVSTTPIYIGDNRVAIINPTSVAEWIDDEQNTSHYTFFQFTALADGKVTISSKGGADTFGTLYDADLHFINSNDDRDADNDDCNFELTFDAKAGEVYYIGARGYDGSINSYTIRVETQMPAPCEVGHHTMGEYVEGIPVTCTTDGTKGYYECSTCHHKYSDAEGEEEIDDLTIPALGHNFVDGQCTREGCNGTVPVLAIGDNRVAIINPTSADEWEDDEQNTSHYTLFKFTALADGKVTISSEGGADTFGTLYDADLHFINSNDDRDEWSGEDYNFELTFDAKAGEVYYIGARGYEGSIGSYTIRVDAPMPASCEVGHHTMGEYVEEIPATCTADGAKGHYLCSVCGRLYSDAEGEEEMDDLRIPALGHNFEDGQCTHEGCDYAIPALQAGGNNVLIQCPTSQEEWNERVDYQHYVLFRYTVQTDCSLVISAAGDMDTYGVLYDGSLNYIGYSDDGNGNGSDFKFVVDDAKAGDVYCIGARFAYHDCYQDAYAYDYTINVIENIPVAVVGDVKYNTLDEALENINDGETVTLLADVEEPNGADNEFYIYVTATLDLNGHTLYGSFLNHGSLTIEDSSDDKTGKIIAGPDDHVFVNNSSDNSITINGGTFVGGQITSNQGVFYLNGGTFILPGDSDFGYTMCHSDNIVFGDNIVYRDLSGEHEDISEVTEFIMYSGEFVEAGTATGVSPLQSTESLKTLKTIENGKVVIIRGDKKYDISGREL